MQRSRNPVKTSTTAIRQITRTVRGAYTHCPSRAMIPGGA